MEKCNYKLNRKKFFQKELTYKQDKLLWDLYIEISGKAPNDEITIDNLRSMLLGEGIDGENNLMQRFLNIVLLPSPLPRWQFWKKKKDVELCKADVENMPNSQLDKIFSDFFLLNKPFLIRLATFGNVLGTTAQTVLRMQENRKATSSAVQKSANTTLGATSSNTMQAAATSPTEKS